MGGPRPRGKPPQDDQKGLSTDMEIMNCEQYVLAELEAAQKENEELRDRIAELERFGLDLLKKRLLEYADKLDAEASKSEGDE